MTFPLSARVASGVAGLVVTLYVVMSASFAAPSGEFTRATAPLRDLGRPYFSQSWNVFAPNILKSNIELEIAAQWRDDDGELEHGGWFSATELELAAVAGQLLPSRTIKQSWNLGQAYNRRYLELDDAQRAYVQDTFVDPSAGGGFEARTEEELVEDLIALGGDRGDVTSLLRYDDIVKEYATYLATAYYGERIERVRWRVTFDRVNSFENRHDEAAEFRDRWRAWGWRHADDRIDPAVLREFEGIVERGGGGDRG